MAHDANIGRVLRAASSTEETSVGSFGGHPRGIRSHLWPRCTVCGSPMCHMAQIDAGPWLDLGSWVRMTVFICHATGGRCEDWDPWKGSNRVVLQRASDDNLYDGPPTVRVYRRVRLTADAPADEAQQIRALAAGGLSPKAALERFRVDKFGGVPAWLHHDDTPRSRVTNAPLQLVLQLTTNIVAYDITKGGVAWVFIDPNDPSEEAARLLWQGG